MNNAFFLTKWFFLAMRWIYESLSSVLSWDAAFVIFLTIAIFTLFIRAISIPSDIASKKSAAKMSAIQPDLDKLRKKYGSDPQKLNAEQGKFMKERGISPFGGCLPLLITMPLFFIFISAFRAWSNEQMLRLLLMMDTDPEAGIALFDSYKFLWISNIWRPDNLTSSAVMTAEEFWRTFTTKNSLLENFIYFSENQSAFEELLLRMGYYVQDTAGALHVAPDSTNFMVAYQQIMGPCIDRFAGFVNGYALMPVIAGGTSFLQSWIMMKNQTPTDPNAPGANTGKSMMYIMPIMTVFFCWSYDSTFAMYWTFSNIYSIIMTLIINKNMPKIIANSEAKRLAKQAKKEQ